MQIKIQQIVCLALAAIIGVTSTGCSSWSKQSPTSADFWKPNTWFKKEFQAPGSIATIWKADKITLPGQPTQRGFGARVYFYNERSQAIPVEGDLVIHGYMTTPGKQQSESDEPDRKFMFTGEQLASQYSPSDMGASYSIWVPWDVEGGFREEVTLIATFKSKQGGIVQGAPTRLFLPGKSRDPQEATHSPSQPIQQVSYEYSSIPTYDIKPSPAKAPTRITTIELPTDSHSTIEAEGVSVGGSR